MDYQAKLLQMIDHIIATEAELLNDNVELQEGFQRTAADWTAQDVSAHLSEWRLIAAEKLMAISRNEVVAFKHDDLAELNRRNYEKHRADQLTTTRQLLMESCHILQRSIRTVSNRQLEESGQLLGFSLPLWRYAMIDGFTHPLIHWVAFHLEKQMFREGLSLWENGYPLLDSLQPNEGLIRGYFHLEGLLDDAQNEVGFKESWEQFLRDNQRQPLIGNEIVAGFVFVNGIN